MSPQPRPVVLASRILGAFAILAGVFPAVGRAFGWIDWTVSQGDAYFLAVNAVVAAVALVFGLQAEKRVTPVQSPRDDAGVPFVPIADDVFEDEPE